MRNSILICLIYLNINLFGQITWTNQQSNTSASLNDVFFINSDTGWIVGANGTILSTVNSGNEWISQTSPVTTNLNSIHFTNSNNGWIVGENGTLIFTSNKGEDWFQKQIGIDASIHDIFFINDSIGWLCCDANPSIHKTIDKGNNWISLSEGMLGNTTIHFINENIGWTAIGSAINKTVDGGENWNMTVLDNANIHSIYFINEDYGFCVGSPFCAYKTNNGGLNWDVLTIQDCLWLNDVFFISQDTGWTVGDGIFQTVNGGSIWTKIYSNPISAVYFIDQQKGWAVGENGTILHHTLEINSTKQNVDVNSINFMYSYENDIIFIGFLIQKPCNVEISIYDLTGVKVHGLFSEYSNIGIMTINLSLNNLRQGVYLCNIQMNDFIYTKKIIK